MVESTGLAQSFSALHATLLDLSCEVTNNRIASEQAGFNLQDSIIHLRSLVAQLQERLEQVEHIAREARYQVAIARLDHQQLLFRVQAVEETLDLHSLD